MPGAAPARSRSCRAQRPPASHGLSSSYLRTDGGEHGEGSAQETAGPAQNPVASFARMLGRGEGREGPRRKEVDRGGGTTGFLRRRLSLRPVGSWASRPATPSLSFPGSKSEDKTPPLGARAHSADAHAAELASVSAQSRVTRFQLCGPHGLCHFSTAVVVHEEPQAARTYRASAARGPWSAGPETEPPARPGPGTRGATCDPHAPEELSAFMVRPPHRNRISWALEVSFFMWKHFFHFFYLKIVIETQISVWVPKSIVGPRRRAQRVGQHLADGRSSVNRPPRSARSPLLGGACVSVSSSCSNKKHQRLGGFNSRNSFSHS